MLAGTFAAASAPSAAAIRPGVSGSSMVGGTLASEMVCKQNGATITATSMGSFTPTGFNVRARTVMTGAQSMTMTATTMGRRIGACR